MGWIPLNETENLNILQKYVCHWTEHLFRLETSEYERNIEKVSAHTFPLWSLAF